MSDIRHSRMFLAGIQTNSGADRTLLSVRKTWIAQHFLYKVLRWDRTMNSFLWNNVARIARHRQAGKTIRQIAAAMDRAPSTIARELKRNSGTQVGYQPAYAEQQAKSRRWRGSRLLRKPDLQEEVLKGLRQGWSPAQVAGRLKKEQRRTVISHETIYRFIDSQIRRTKDYSWRHYLPRGKSKRGWRGHKGGSPVDHIQDRVAIDRRPAYIHKRRQAGHWEGDLMLFAKYGQAVLVTHERRSRLLVVSRQPNKAADPVATKLTDLFRCPAQDLTSNHHLR